MSSPQFGVPIFLPFRVRGIQPACPRRARLLWGAVLLALQGCSGDPQALASGQGLASGNEAGGQMESSVPEVPEDVDAIPISAEVTASGLASRILVEGQAGISPGPRDTVRVHYTGWQTNGEQFDSSRGRGAPSEFALDGVIAGWTEGLQLMVEGEERRFWVPEELAYRGVEGYPAGMLVFDVELLAVLTD